jgi:hypothetical protein
MTVKSPPRRASAPAASASPLAWNWAAELALQQFAAGTEGGALLYRGCEAMRRIQEQAVQQALHRHAAATRDLGAAPRPADALALQSELLRGDMEDAARCWQQLVGQAMEVGNELAACATRLVNTDDAFAVARLFHRASD